MSGRRIEPGGTILRKKAAWRNGLMVGNVSVNGVAAFNSYEHFTHCCKTFL